MAELSLSAVFLSALISGFFAVRIIKGPWRRYPQYLAVAIVGAMVAAIGLHAYAPATDHDLIIPTIACFIGSWLAVYAFDQLIGAE